MDFQVFLHWAHMGVSSGEDWYTSLVIPIAFLDIISIFRLVFFLYSCLLHFLKCKKNKAELTIVWGVKHFDKSPALFEQPSSRIQKLSIFGEIFYFVMDYKYLTVWVGNLISKVRNSLSKKRQQQQLQQCKSHRFESSEKGFSSGILLRFASFKKNSFRFPHAFHQLDTGTMRVFFFLINFRTRG